MEKHLFRSKMSQKHDFDLALTTPYELNISQRIDKLPKYLG